MFERTPWILIEVSLNCSEGLPTYSVSGIFVHLLTIQYVLGPVFVDTCTVVLLQTVIWGHSGFKPLITRQHWNCPVICQLKSSETRHVDAEDKKKVRPKSCLFYSVHDKSTSDFFERFFCDQNWLKRKRQVFQISSIISRTNTIVAVYEFKNLTIGWQIDKPQKECLFFFFFASSKPFFLALSALSQQ